MFRNTILITVLVVLTAAMTINVAAQARDDYLVTFHDGISKSQVQDWTKEKGCEVLYRFNTSNTLWIKFPAGNKASNEILRQDSLVKHVSEEPVGFPDLVPNDPLYADQWQFNNQVNIGADIQGEHAWSELTSSGAATVAIIDTGFLTTHPDLAGNFIQGWDAADHDSDPSPYLGGYAYAHGTMVAGIVGAVGNNNEGISGVCWDTRMMPFKIQKDGSADAYDFYATVAAVDSAVAYGVDVINCSWHWAWIYSETQPWGAPLPGSAFYAAFEAASDAGIAVVCAAGNDGWDLDDLYHQRYPANFTFENIITVAMTYDVDAVTFGSAYGANTVDIAAPGVGLYSTDVLIDGSPSYSMNSGTSFSSPLVAGSIALIKAARPDLSYPAGVLAAMYDAAETPPGVAGLVIDGRRLNLYRPMVSPDLVAPGAITDLTSLGVTDRSITLQWTESGEDGAVGTIDHFAMRSNYATTPPAQWVYNVVDLPAPQGPGTVHTFVLDDLTIYQLHTIELMAVDEYRNGTTSSIAVQLASPQVSLDPTSIFIMTQTGEVTTASAVFHNTGTWEATLIPWLYTGGGDWLTFPTGTFVIAPQDSLVYEVGFDATGLCMGSFNSQIGFNGGGYNMALGANMFVLDAPDIAVSPAGVNLGEVAINSNHNVPVTITNEGCADLTWSANVTPAGTWSVKPKSGTIPAGGTANLLVMISCLTEASIALNITSNDPFEPTITVPISWRFNIYPQLWKDTPAIVNTWEVYPNPFNPETTIRFSLMEAGDTQLQIFNVRGTVVRTISLGSRGPSIESVVWNGRTNTGHEAPSGIYFCRPMQSGEQIHPTMKLNLIK